MSGPDPRVTFDEFRRAWPAVRRFQKHDHDTRANLMASHRLTKRQRESTGDFFYTHRLGGGVAYRTRGEAERAGFAAYAGAAPATPTAGDLAARHAPELLAEALLVALNREVGHAPDAFKDALDELAGDAASLADRLPTAMEDARAAGRTERPDRLEHALSAAQLGLLAA